MDDLQELRAEVAALAARLDRIEGTVDGVTQPSPVADTEDALWILSGIKSRVPDPGAVFFAGSVQVAAGPVQWQVGFPTDRILESDWSAQAQSIAALASPVRLSILQAVISGASSVAELSADEHRGTTGQLYHHLNQLVAQGWLLASGRGHYEIPGERIVPLLVILTAARRTM